MPDSPVSPSSIARTATAKPADHADHRTPRIDAVPPNRQREHWEGSGRGQGDGPEEKLQWVCGKRYCQPGGDEAATQQRDTGGADTHAVWCGFTRKAMHHVFGNDGRKGQ